MKKILLLAFLVSPTIYGVDASKTPITSSPANAKVTLQASNGQEFSVLQEVAELSPTIKDMIKDLGIDQTIPISQASSPDLSVVLGLMAKIKSLGSQEFKTANELKQLDQQLNLGSFDLNILPSLLNLVNYLDIAPLVKAISMQIAQKVSPTTWNSTKNSIKEKNLQSKVVGYYWVLNKAGLSNSDRGISIRELLDLGHQFKIETTSRALELVDLGINSLDGLNQIPNIDTVKKLYLDHNQLSSLQPGAFQGLINLTYLSLDNNLLSSLQPGAFQGLTNLIGLSLHHNQLSSLQPGAFQGLTNLTELSLDHNQLSSLQPGTFQGLTNLIGLYLYNNPLTPESQKALQDWADAQSPQVSIQF